jgi:sarcosine/dimethylglycine N-methyltransferase
MINRCNDLNDISTSPYKDRITWKVESYLSTSLGNESVDVAFSMDAFLHVGEKLHSNVIKEVWRILRPGGYLVFTDIMQRPEATPEQMAGILKRIHLPALGSLDNYKACAQARGFSNISYEDMSPCLPMHYSTVKQVLHEKTTDGTLSSMSNEFIKDMMQGLTLWESSGEFLQWGIIIMQKTGNPIIDE